MTDCWLNVIDESGAILFECIHNGSSWLFEWSLYGESYSGNIQDVFIVASKISQKHPGSAIKGVLLDHLNESNWC